ncbi:glycosyltransferase [Oceaniglobus trochenteri]|uniref:glycosyltransferase n=1 Tax=Oceaniglobus trochenteri TaxID=2763260 RepID=UPI001CFF7D06|nr:glycosyltransferase [Oceaniglobus trochenteri]
MNRLLGLFSRFSAAHLVLSGPTGPLEGPGGGTIGHLSGVELRQDRLHVHGRVEAGHPLVTLHVGAMTAQARPGPSGGAFAVNLPRPVGLSLRDFRATLDIEGAPPRTITLQRPEPVMARQVLAFAATLLRLGPDIARWYLRQDHRSKARIKAGLGLNRTMTAAGPVADDLFSPPPASSADGAAPRGITIVLPVYNALELLENCLDRLARHTDLPWTLVAVEDGSSDPAVRPALRAWAQGRPPGQVQLIEQDRNRGFIASVNTAFARIREDAVRREQPVILLNTDALVPEGWASRLVAPLSEGADVASVTPMSNDAEIFTAPVICARQMLQPGQGDAIDEVARSLSPARALAEAPTGVGFCMALAPRFLALEPGFDPVFGPGYGEEVDWCQKTRRHGGRHLCTARLFVEHRGGSSFGSEQKKALVARNNRTVSQRYPTYDREVQDFLTVDPLRGPRLALALAWAGAAAGDTGVPIYLAHALGGGAENWLQARIARDAAAGRPSVVLRVGGSERWQIEAHARGGVTAGWTEDLALVERLLLPLKRRVVIYSCGVGDPDPVELPAILLRLRRGPEDRIEVLFHDYLPVSPSFTLLDGQGAYRSELSPADPAHVALRPDGTPVDLASWQAAWGTLLRAADRIRTFSPSSAEIVSGVWPGLEDRITMSPHRLPTLPARIDVSPRAPRVLGVLGNIAPHKGAGIVQALSHLDQGERGGRMVLIGNIDPTYPLSRGCPVHGDYAPGDIPALVAHYGITHWLIPSVWPETFSFTTHEALATGLPVLAFDIGAQGDAVRNAPNGRPLRHDPDTAPLPALLAAFARPTGEPS